MKKIICSITLVFLPGIILKAQTVYINPKFDSIAKGHKELAILPFKVTLKLRPKEMKKLEKAEGEAVQTALLNYFLEQKVKDSFKVSSQDISRTNALLAQIGWTNDSYRPKKLEDVYRQLKVDGVITGTLTTSKLLSDEGSAVLMGLVIVLAIGTLGQSGIDGPDPTNKGTCAIDLHDSKSGELLWQYEKTLSRGMCSTTQSVINAMMRKASKKFPYEE